MILAKSTGGTVNEVPAVTASSAAASSAPTQRALRTLEWVDRHENLVVCGPSGTGKTHFLEALGQAVLALQETFAAGFDYLITEGVPLNK